MKWICVNLVVNWQRLEVQTNYNFLFQSALNIEQPPPRDNHPKTEEMLFVNLYWKQIYSCEESS